ncbi:Beta-fimbriae probable major subunit [Pseudomonas orientalis]|nr:Beta-fimbriae probable major subunit [Pseudomonas orientalis]
MKTRFTILAAGIALLSSANTFAASSVDLTVKGLIVPSACTPSLSSGGVIDHGKVSAKDLNPDRNTIIGNHTLSMAVNCDAPIQFALHSIDNRAASGSTIRYGLGFINDAQKLGGYILTFANPIAEGSVVVQPIASADQGNTWYSEKFWDPGMYMSVASMEDDTQPLAVKDLRVDLEVQTIINRTDGLD